MLHFRQNNAFRARILQLVFCMHEKIIVPHKDGGTDFRSYVPHRDGGTDFCSFVSHRDGDTDFCSYVSHRDGDTDFLSLIFCFLFSS